MFHAADAPGWRAGRSLRGAPPSPDAIIAPNDARLFVATARS
ncbi:MAG: hypothetical protein AAB368_13110 [bacterium]